MQFPKILFFILISVLIVSFYSCGEQGEKEEKGELSSEKSEGHDEGGEESGAELGLNDTYDVKQKGARLILKYDAESNSFVGTVTNLTGDMLENVRVEVHTSNGKEIGPSEAQTLKPGVTKKIVLKAESTDFESWSAHAEVGRFESGHDEK